MKYLNRLRLRICNKKEERKNNDLKKKKKYLNLANNLYKMNLAKHFTNYKNKSKEKEHKRINFILRPSQCSLLTANKNILNFKALTFSLKEILDVRLSIQEQDSVEQTFLRIKIMLRTPSQASSRPPQFRPILAFPRPTSCPILAHTTKASPPSQSAVAPMPPRPPRSSSPGRYPPPGMIAAQQKLVANSGKQINLVDYLYSKIATFFYSIILNANTGSTLNKSPLSISSLTLRCLPPLQHRPQRHPRLDTRRHHHLRVRHEHHLQAVMHRRLCDQLIHYPRAFNHRRPPTPNY